VTEERQPESTAGGEAASTGEPVETQPQTVEEVEAFWRNRFSNRDRAHNAETAALRAQIDAARATPPSTAPVPGESPEAARVRELEAQLARESQARQVAQLQQKYPAAAATVGDAILAMEETRIIGLEAALSGAAPTAAPRSVIDPNAAPRRAAGPAPGSPEAKPLNEKTKDELLGDLKRLAPAFQQAAKEGIVS
jgi:hypothetical protein